MKADAIRWAQGLRIKSGPSRVLQALVSRMNPRTGACFPSIETLAKDAHCAESTVHEALHDLEAHGLITKVLRRKDGRQTSNDYHLHVGSKPKPIGKRRDTVRRAQSKIVQAPKFGASPGSSSHRNSEPAQAPKFGPELYTSEVWKDGEGSRFQPGVELPGDEFTNHSLADKADGHDADPFTMAANGTGSGPAGNTAVASLNMAKVPELPERYRAKVVNLPSGQARPWSVEDWLCYYEERAGIAEYDGALARAEAEAQAFDDCVAEWLNQCPAGSLPDRRAAVAVLVAMSLTAQDPLAEPTPPVQRRARHA